MKEKIVEIGKKIGCMIPENWSGVDILMPIINRMTEEKAVFILKIDGERTSPSDAGMFTVMISQEFYEFFDARGDGYDLETALSIAIVKYSEKFWEDS